MGIPFKRNMVTLGRPSALLLLSLLLSVLVSDQVSACVPLDQDGDHVCFQTVSFLQTITVSYPQSYQQYYVTSCGLWSFCTKVRVQYRTVYGQEVATAYKEQRECCSGYTEPGDGNCYPVCDAPCANGACTEPDVCTCDSGWTGDDCSIVLS